jgi:hypothetical protein
MLTLGHPLLVFSFLSAQWQTMPFTMRAALWTMLAAMFLQTSVLQMCNMVVGVFPGENPAQAGTLSCQTMYFGEILKMPDKGTCFHGGA